MLRDTISAVKEAARGRWPEILSALGAIPRDSLDGKHHPCPRPGCGGKDRFRMIDEQAGAVLCSQCFDKGNGDGLAALQWATGDTFPNVVKRLADYLGLDNGNGSHNGNGQHIDPLELLARKKRCPVESLRKYGAKVSGPRAEFPVYDVEGKQCSTFTIDPRKDGKAGKGLLVTGKPAGLFLPHEHDGKPCLPKPGETWHMVEGVKDAAALYSLGLLAVGLPTCKMAAKFAPIFTGVNVVLIPDRDRAGANGAETTAARLHKVAAWVRIVALPVEFKVSGGLDVRDVLALPDGETLLRKAIETALPWEPTKPTEDENGIEPAQDKPKEPPTFTKLIGCAALLALDNRQRYLVRGVLVAGQPCVGGGRSKTLKTSIVGVDLAVSLGSGSPFLGHFPTERCRVAVWSGESGVSTMRETARRIATAKCVELADCSVLWSFSLPKLSHMTHLDHLRQTITDNGIQVAIIDPLYLALLDAETAGHASNVFAMGAALQPVGEIGQQTKCTMVVLHHFRKSGQADPDEPAALEDLAQSGVVEWARQWILLARRSPYASDGRHQLWLRAGGSAGHAGLYAVDVVEGVFDPDTADGGRRWDVAVRSVTDVRAEVRKAKGDHKAQQIAKRQDDDRGRMLEALLRCPSGETITALRQLARLSGTRAGDSLRTLVGEGLVETCEVKKYTRTETGYRLTTEPGQPRTDPGQSGLVRGVSQ